MALIKKDDNFFGHTQDTYVKISKKYFEEIGSDESGKLYSMAYKIDFYTSDTKEFHFSQIDKKADGLRLADDTFSVAYEKAKLEPEMEGFIDVI